MQFFLSSYYFFPLLPNILKHPHIYNTRTRFITTVSVVAKQRAVK
jgi:hypothetical protein